MPIEKEDCIALIRSLLSSTTDVFNIRRLLREFKEEAGVDLPLFGYRTVTDFLRSIPDTVKIVGDEIRLVKSEKSAHMVELVDNQKDSSKRRRVRRRRPPSFRPAPRRDLRPPRLNNPPPRHSSYSSRSYTPNLPPRLSNSSYSQKGATSAVNIPDSDKNRLRDFLRKYPDGATFNEVTNHLLGRGERWSKYYIQDGVPELVNHCREFCTIHAGLVFSNYNYDQFMKKTKVEVPANGCMPAGNESDYSDDEFYFDEYDDEDDEYAANYNSHTATTSTQQYSNKSQAEIHPPKKKDIHPLKIRLKEIVSRYPNGLWCSELFYVYHKFYSEELEFHDYGYNNLIDMLNDMSDALKCSKGVDQDWIVYTVDSESNGQENGFCDIYDEKLETVKSNLLTLLNSRNVIQEYEIPPLYFKMFKERLNYEELGFEDFQSFMNSLENVVFHRMKSDHTCILIPVEKIQRELYENANGHVPKKPLYPEEVVGPGESLPRLDLRDHAKVGQYIEVSVAEVWNPSKFFLHLREFKPELHELMDRLQAFHNKIKDHYQMPEECIVPDQICTALYDLNATTSEWHRAEIVKIIDENRVLVNLVDYGTSTKLAKSRLRFLNKDFASLPCQAFMARLHKTVPKEGVKWSKEANARFLELVFNKDLVAGVSDIDYKKNWMSVALTITTQHKEIHISDTLIDEGLASFQDDLFGDQVKEEAGPKKNMKSNNQDIFVIEEEEELINTSTNSEKSKPEVNAQSLEKNSPSHNPAGILNQDLLTSVSEILANSAVNPSALLNPESYLNSAAAAIPPVDPVSALINQMSGLSLLPKSLSSLAPPPGFSYGDLPFIAENLKQKINAAAIQIVTYHPQVRSIAIANPEMALQIAMKIAEDMYKVPEVPQPVSDVKPELIAKPPGLVNNQSRQPELVDKRTIPNVAYVFPTQSQAPPVPKKVEKVTGVPRKPIQVVSLEENNLSNPAEKVQVKRKIQVAPAFEETNEVFPLDEKNITPEKRKSVITIKEARLIDKTIHIIIINGKLFILVEEVIRSLTPFSSRKVVEQVAKTKKCSYKYQIITEESDPDVYEAIKRKNIPVVEDTGNFYTILPLKSIVKFLREIGNIDELAVISVLKFVSNCEMMIEA